MYSIIKVIHVLLAIAALGSNITYGAWYARSAREPEHLSFALRGIRFIDDRIANPCYGLLLVTGLVLVFVGKWPWPQWIITALVLYVGLVVIALAGYSPSLRRQIAALEAEGSQSGNYLRWAGPRAGDRDRHRSVRLGHRLHDGRQAQPLMTPPYFLRTFRSLGGRVTAQARERETQLRAALASRRQPRGSVT